MAAPTKSELATQLRALQKSLAREKGKSKRAEGKLAETLAQQVATAEILRVISTSPSEVQPVFDAIASSATRLCDATFCIVFRFDGEMITVAADAGRSPGTLDVIRAAYPSPPGRQSISARAIAERRVISIADAQKLKGSPEQAKRARAIGYRSILAVPMMRGDAAIGTINVARLEAVPFSDTQVELLKSFADQAVIAIENVRLFNETKEALERQTATAEILQVIGSSPTDTQPVFDAIVSSGVRLFPGAMITVARPDGGTVRAAAIAHEDTTMVAGWRERFTTPLSRDRLHAAAILDAKLIDIPDAEAEKDGPLGPGVRNFLLSGNRAVTIMPMLRGEGAIGAISVTRSVPGPLSDKQVAILRTFAGQAVIAIENVRLFKELEARTGELTQLVEQLTALEEVSRAVNSTLDVETVLDTIVSRASQLAGGAGCSIYEYDEGAEQFELRATHHDDPAFVKALRAAPLHKGEGLMGRAAEMREPIQIPDITQPGAYQSSVRDTLMQFGYRALLAVPLLREDQIIGSLSLTRKAPGEYAPEVIDVLKSFATQSALAIQNARLFREIADKSAQLEAASRHKSEFLANMSHELRTPLNAIIGFSEVLVDRMFGELNDKQEEYLKDIYASGQHLLSLINDILDLSKIEAGRMELEVTDFDLPSTIDNALILMRERASRRGITLGHSVDERLGPIRGDERKVKQVLLNLLSNALKFTPEGGRIDVGARVHDGVAEIVVTDTGVGIAPEDQEAVFEEFRQVGTADKKVEGTGLGLALSRKFIELHGGRIWVKSQVGHGSTFTFTLPVGREA